MMRRTVFHGRHPRPRGLGPLRRHLAPLLALACLLIAAPDLSRQARAGEADVGIAMPAGLSGAGLLGLSGHAGPSVFCDEAIRRAELRHGLPAGLLSAIGQAESGRPDPATHRLEPWPWTVQAEDRSLYFETKAQAVQWVQEARARGVTSIDAGCLQVNLYFHPQAFETVDAAFDPRRNADYAARFLLQLYAATNDWGQAIGFYHSHTASLAAPYQQRVQRAMSGAVVTKRITVLGQLGEAWRSTLASSDPVPAHRPGNDWDTLLRGRSWAAAAPPSPRRSLRLTSAAR